MLDWLKNINKEYPDFWKNYLDKFETKPNRFVVISTETSGLNPDKDVTLLQTGGEATRLAALVNGSIDATVLNPPVHKRAVEAGMRVMANMAEMEIPFQNSALVATQRYIAKNPDVMRRLVKSFVEGIHLIRTNPEVTKRAIAKYMRMKDQKELDEAYEILDSLTQRKPYPTLEGFKTSLSS